MKTRPQFWFRILFAGVVVAALALIGCGGGGGNNNSSSSSDGGGTTPPPTTQDSGVVVEGDPGSAITLPTNPTVNAAAIVGKNAVLDMSQSASFENGKLTVHFFLKDKDNADANTNGISLTENSCDFRAYASQLTTATGPDDPGPGWHQVDNDSANGGALDTLPGLLTVINGTTGEYSYTFADDGVTGRHEYAGGGIAAAMANPNNTLRATLVINCAVEVNGSDYTTVKPVNGSYDFSTGDPGTELTDSGAEIVSSAACFTCHGPTLAGVNDSGLDQETDHGRYTEVKTCTQCHALNSYVSNQNADLAPFIHSIHSGQPSQANGGGTYQSGHDFAGAEGQFGPVGYPNNLWNCAKCHADGTAVDKATADGEAGPVAAEADLAYSNPTRRACGGCHADVNFETGENHGPGGIGGPRTDDTQCTACHTPSGPITGIVYPVKTVHDVGPTGPDPKNQSEFTVDISMDPPANGTDYEAGETPVITVTLTPRDGGPAVNYTAAQDTIKGTRDGNLNVANLFVYGPRSHAVPVLTTCSATDDNFINKVAATCGANATTPTQGHNLFVGSTVNSVADAQVKTDATGFKYQLMDDIDKLPPGTYMVRVEAADYGGVSNDDYVTSSSALITFQVGTADEEPKVSGNGCLNCHGDTIMHLEGSHAHHAPFDTDYCLACHDYSGNHGDYIGNRVHAVHHETFSGDAIEGRVWTEVSFPQEANNCSICHTNSAAVVPVWRSTEPLACGGCHGTDPDAVTNAEAYLANPPSGVTITASEAEKIMARAPKEATAASHMLSMMAVPGGTRDDFITYGSEPVAGCLVCHGPGQPQDLYQAMGLATFGIPIDTSGTE
jgi:OmcA/MtrC family decaheme c-type cytochrome